jgi:hypothetical protein
MKSACLSSGVAVLTMSLALTSAMPLAAAIVYSQNFETVPTAGGPPATALLTTSNAGPSVDHPDNVNFSTVSSNTSPHLIQAVVDTGNTFGAGTSNQYMQYVDGGSGDPRAIAPAGLNGTGFQLTFDIVDPVTAETGPARVLLSASNLGNESVLLFFTDGTLQGFHNNVTTRDAQTKANAYTTGVKHSVTVVGNYSGSTINYGAGSSQSVAPGTYDVWIDSVLHPEFNDAKFRHSETLSITSTTHFAMNSSNGASSSLNVDNIVIQDAIVTQVPEPSALVIAVFGVSVLGVRTLRRQR